MNLSIYGIVPGSPIEQALSRLALTGVVNQVPREGEDGCFAEFTVYDEAEPDELGFRTYKCTVLLDRQTSTVRQVSGNLLMKDQDIILKIGDHANLALSFFQMRSPASKGRDFVGVDSLKTDDGTFDLVLMCDDCIVQGITLGCEIYQVPVLSSSPSS